ncbi:hypothetical protein QR680_008124 [Steinernema hermaphroditum]|uniref:Serine/threonine specific protein phosphatases domain-containing protein n=1 Tax=Steinernema hermaphroditum TaxID=289476 RepID=A0AA39IFH8_9BILA|nr:hypothetical protein QR680_008124 [Steinernema hermaphroditum]
MLRVICLFHTTNQQGIQYIVRSRPERWVDTSSDALQTEYFYTIGVERLTTRSIESTIRSRLLKGKTPFSVKGVVRHAIANPFDGRRFYRTYFVGIQVPDASFRFRLLHNEKYEWTSSKDLLAQVARGKISTNVADAVKMSEEGTYIPMAEIYDAEMNVQDVVKVYENLFTDNQRFLLKEASFGVRQMERIYRIYLEIVWPNSLMNFDDFERFFRKHEMRMGSDSKSLYRAFNLSKEDGINFFDFILALAAIQPDTPHGKISGDLRTRYIFRYYCADCENKFARLTRHEIEALLSDIMKAKKSTVPVNNPDLVHKDLDLNKFVAKVGTLKIRGTSNLLRMRKPILIDLSSPGEEQRLPRTPLEPVRRDENGAIYPNQLYPPSNLLLGVTEPRMVEHAVTLLSSLRYFCKMAVDANDRKKAFHWGRMNKRILMKQFIDVCSDATAILQAEDRCLKVNGNLCIFGDLHGRYDDLRQFEAKLWPLGFECSDQKCLFLGNYACKGLYGFEVVAYLAALKVLHPNKIFLLRGAYDTKKMQNQYGFSGELAGKFSFNSSEVFAAATKFFDTLPLACIVNKKIFCCHSGIPHPAEYKEANLLDAMNSLPKTIDGAQLDFGKCIGLQFLFNDLVSESHVNVDEEGFTVAPNGSAHAFLFNEAALMRCLGLMGCTHMVRGGTASPNGVRIQKSSHNLNHSNMSFNKGFKLTAQATLRLKVFGEHLPEAPKKYMKKRPAILETETTDLNVHSNPEVQQVAKKLIKGIESSGNQKSNMKLFEELMSLELDAATRKTLHLRERVSQWRLHGRIPKNVAFDFHQKHSGFSKQRWAMLTTPKKAVPLPKVAKKKTSSIEKAPRKPSTKKSRQEMLIEELADAEKKATTSKPSPKIIFIDLVDL